jgi:predicted DNA-binding transcriptional regulator AlpA
MQLIAGKRDMTDQVGTLLDRAIIRPASFDLISIRQIAQQYGYSVRTLRRWQKAGRMPQRYRQGGTLMYRSAEIDELMKSKV